MAPPPEAADGAGQGAGRLCPAGPAARAPTPEGDGSVAGGRRIHLCADGSGHGGRHYFQGPQVPCQQQQQQQQSEGHHSALWVVEDGGPRGGTPPPAGPPPDGSVKDSSGGKGSSFSGAVVMIEEPSDASMFDWGTYWSSLPKKLKGACQLVCCPGGYMPGPPHYQLPPVLLDRPAPCRCLQVDWTRGFRCQRCAISSGPGWAPS